jgi:hypothetical protein
VNLSIWINEHRTKPNNQQTPHKTTKKNTTPHLDDENLKNKMKNQMYADNHLFK